MRSATLLALLALAIAAETARAEDACTAFKWSVGREQKAFAMPDLPKVATGAALPAAGAVRLTLAPQESVAYTVKPAREPRHKPAYGAELTMQAPPAGTVQVTLSDDAWVDVVQDGKVLRSSAFSGVVGCPGLRKSVRFTLGAGPALVAIRDAPAATLDVAVLPAN